MKKTMVIKLLGTLAIVAALAAMCIAPVSATTTTTGVPTPPGIPTLTYTGFMMKANMHLTDLTGVASTTNYQYVDLNIATDVAGAVVGNVYLYPTNTVKGVVIAHPTTSGGASWTKPAISASFTMHITKLGTFIVTCPKGVAGTATSGTTTVTGSVKTLAEGTSTTVTTTGVTGNITIAFHLVKRSMTINATGFVGSGYKPQVALTLADTSGYFAGILNGRLYLNSNNTVKSLTGRIDGMIDLNGVTSGGQTIFDTTGYGLARSTE
jgi:hypothetical protein